MSAAALDVLVPTYRRPAALAVTLTSLTAQTLPRSRVVVSDQTGDARRALAQARHHLHSAANAWHVQSLVGASDEHLQVVERYGGCGVLV